MGRVKELVHDAKEIVLKAQILAGGRGKGVFDSGLKGGVHLTRDPAVVGELASKMLGYSLTTKQTPKDGVKVKTVMVAEALDISRETYFAILMDRACNGPVMVGSPQGGVDIEEVAAKTPELIFKVHARPFISDPLIIHSVEHVYPGTRIPWNTYTLEHVYPGTRIPWNTYTLERIPCVWMYIHYTSSWPCSVSSTDHTGHSVVPQFQTVNSIRTPTGPPQSRYCVGGGSFSRLW
ncbi:hypothetical protein NFI96_003177 [Prochilodus magdalenae]|nr:hypothetical protein NFI96_003177 [Prochilodus magdalenae]